MESISKFNVIVVGAGPAGFFAAINAARNGARVVVLEKQTAPGRKLLATGGGRCNVTNTLSSKEFISDFGVTGRFMTSALRELRNVDLLKLLDSWGVPCFASDGFHYFPRSQCANDVLSALMQQITDMHIDLQFGVSVKNISSQDNLINVSVSDGRRFVAHSLVLATGGVGYPALGGNSSGYELAKNIGHVVIDPVPGLTGLCTREGWPGECTGITLADVRVKIAERGFKGRMGSGDLLFTHRGISGPSVIDISGSVCRLLLTQESVKLTLRLCKEYESSDDWREQLLVWRREQGKRCVHNVIASVLPKRLASILCTQCGVTEDMIMARLPGAAEKQLVAILSKTELNVTASEGWGHAMVTAGGVSLKEVDSSTLSSKIMPGLYFAGEILNLDGPCGGYNLQWAMSSGWLAGKSAVKHGVV